MEPVTLTIEEIEKFKEFQAKNQELINYLGQIELQKLNLELSRDQIKQDMIGMSDEQNKFAQDIQTKYGEGQIDIEKGVFIPFTQYNQ
tara:strand:+ start:845 stop:1108 length:264 start_codon:yes stop_codon:yes gene_type:complete